MNRIVIFLLAACTVTACAASAFAGEYNDGQCQNYIHKYETIPADDFCEGYGYAQFLKDRDQMCRNVWTNLNRDIDAAYLEARNACWKNSVTAMECEQVADRERTKAREVNTKGYEDCKTKQFFR